MKKSLLTCSLFLLLVLSLCISGCKKDTTSTPVAVNNGINDINIATSATLGRYLTTKSGLALYMFANDADGTSTCTGDCETLWPAFTINATNPALDSSLKAADFGSITNAAGKTQVTYRGWPLHTYSPAGTSGYGNNANTPEPPGATGGDGFAGLWFLARPDYTVMLANTQLKGLDGNLYKSDYSLGQGLTTYFTDGAGKTLYTFVADSFNINKFTNPDLSNNGLFPIYEQENVVVPSILDKSLFGSIPFAGKKQLTYKGWPLYYFGQDVLRGSNEGISFPSKAVWPVAVKDIAQATK